MGIRTLIVLLALPLAAADFYPLDRVRPGMKAVGRTVFAGDKVEEFQAEILGVLENVGPRQSIILARLSGGPLAKTGVMQGMSGSPVYIDGKLVGAVALGFQFSTEPIAGIRPISEMVETFVERAEPPPASLRARLVNAGAERWIPPAEARLLPPALDPLPAQPQIAQIATPVHFSGFTARTIEVFGPALRTLGLAPLQGAGGAARSASAEIGDPSSLQPGSMISVGLIRGDMNVTADGALTHIDGRKVYAFGHRFLSAGPTELPFMKSSVVALLPNLSHSFKISSSGQLMGTIRQDRATGVFGELGVRPRMIPVELNLHSSRSGNQRYRLELVHDRYLSPFLLQIAIFSGLDATERLLGGSTYQVRGSIQFAAGSPAVELDNIYSGDLNIANTVALGAAVPMAQLMQSGFADLRVERVRLDVASFDQKRQLKLERAWVSPREARPGETVELGAALRDEDGRETVRKLPFRVPLGAAAGTLNVTFADGVWMNLQDMQGGFGAREAASGPQLVRAMNRARRNSNLYVRLWRAERGFQLPGEPLPAPPASLRSLLAGGAAGVLNTWSTTLAELEVDNLGTLVSGTETLRLTIKE